MDRAAGVALSVWIMACALGCGGKPTPAQGAPTEQRAVPSWLPAYSGAQRALKEAPAPVPVLQRATLVYPELDHFAFTHLVPFELSRAQRTNARVDQTIASSKRLYVMHALRAAEDANWIPQYGPAAEAEPDPWVRASKPEADASLGAPLSLVPAAVPRAYAAAFKAANTALSERRLADAAAGFKALAEELGDVPAVSIITAELALSQRDFAMAEQHLKRALSIDPRSPDAHRVLARLRLERGDTEGGRQALAKALALYPLSQRSWALALKHFKPPKRPEMPPVWLDVSSAGAVHVASLPVAGHRAYARCRAALRYEPELREAALGLAPPYRLSMGEELMCHEALLAAVSAEPPSGAARPAAPEILAELGPDAGPRDVLAPGPQGAPVSKPDQPAPPSAPSTPGTPSAPVSKPDQPAPPSAPSAPVSKPDQPAPPSAPSAPGASATPGAPPPAGVSSPDPHPPAPSAPQELTLAELAAQGQLARYVLFDVIGRVRPAWLRTAPNEHHEALVDYVARYILR